MKRKIQRSSSALSLLAQSVFYFDRNGYKDCDQLVGFFDERFEFLDFYDPRFDQQFEPVSCFVEFLQSAFDLVDEVG
jgi:hypothetical protein